jgi:uncharacterized glyoxalase superfamily protein PhnB
VPRKKLKPIVLTRRIKPQAAEILDYLTTGRTLTGIIATVTLSVTSVTSRIAELRAAGVKIKTEWDHDHTGKRYAKYTLDDSAD